MEWVIAIVSIVMSIIVWMFLKSDSHSHLPGPMKLPIIGHLHLLLKTPFPPKRMQHLAAKYGPLMHLRFGQVPYIIISSPETAKQVMKTHDIIFSNRPPSATLEVLTNNYTNIGYAPYGEYWRQLRRICTAELLSMKRVKSLLPMRQDENLRLAKALASRSGSPVDMSEKIFVLGYDIITRAALGEKTKMDGNVAPLLKVLTRLASGFLIADCFPSLKFLPHITGLRHKIDQNISKMHAALAHVIEEHRAATAAGQTGGDLADVLLGFQAEGDQLPLTDANIAAVLLDIIIAASETTAGTIEWTMSELMKNPNVMKKLQKEVRGVFDQNGCMDEEKFTELTYLKLVIKETLRLHPPLPLIVPRISSDRCVIDGYEIPRGTRCLINTWALGRDPKYWNDADKYMPERFEEKSEEYSFNGTTFEYLPFGSGRRICPGMSFGLANLEFSLVSLLYHFDWELPPGVTPQNLDMTDEFGSTVCRKHPLILIPTLKRPLL